MSETRSQLQFAELSDRIHLIAQNGSMGMGPALVIMINVRIKEYFACVLA